MANTVSAYYLFTSTSKANSSEVNSMFNLYRGTVIPINEDTASASDNTHDLGSSDYNWRDLYLSGSLINGSTLSIIRTGTIIKYTSSTSPSNYLLCDGSSLSRITYSNLFNALTNYTETNPAYGYETATHFNLPDLRGRFLRGVDEGAGNDPDASSRTAQGTNGNTGDTLGSLQNYATYNDFNSSVTISVSHTHQANAYDTNTGANTMAMHQVADGGPSALSFDTGGDHSHSLSGFDSETRPINIGLSYYIKY